MTEHKRFLSKFLIRSSPLVTYKPQLTLIYFLHYSFVLFIHFLLVPAFSYVYFDSSPVATAFIFFHFNTISYRFVSFSIYIDFRFDFLSIFSLLFAISCLLFFLLVFLNSITLHVIVISNYSMPFSFFSSSSSSSAQFLLLSYFILILFVCIHCSLLSTSTYFHFFLFLLFRFSCYHFPPFIYCFSSLIHPF